MRMLHFILRRLVWMVVTFFVTTMVVFAIIQLPPGDFMTSYVETVVSQGGQAGQDTIQGLRRIYGLDQPAPIQYFKWMKGIITRGDLGLAFDPSPTPINRIIWERVWLTMGLCFGSLLITWLIAFFIGIFSAVRQYSLGDYAFTFLGFIGIAVPSFLLALVLMYVRFKYFGITTTGLFSNEYLNAPWSLGRLADLLKNIWLPMLILAMEGTATLVRVMRANLLDELRKPYVITARAKGLPETRLLLKYPVRLALNPFVSTLGWSLPNLMSTSVILGVVMNLPTTGPMLLRALTIQDMYLAGAVILILSTLTIVGTLLSDLLLAWLDPRIRYQ